MSLPLERVSKPSLSASSTRSSGRLISAPEKPSSSPSFMIDHHSRRGLVRISRYARESRDGSQVDGATAHPLHDRMDTARHAVFPLDVLDVRVRGLFADRKNFANFPIAFSQRRPLQDFAFSLGERRQRMLSRSPDRP